MSCTDLVACVDSSYSGSFTWSLAWRARHEVSTLNSVISLRKTNSCVLQVRQSRVCVYLILSVFVSLNSFIQSQLQCLLFRDESTGCSLLVRHVLTVVIVRRIVFLCLVLIWTWSPWRLACSAWCQDTGRIKVHVVISTLWNPDRRRRGVNSDSGLDSLFSKFYNKESVSKAVSIQT